MAGGFDEPKAPGDKPLRRSRIPVAEFAAAISLGSQERLDTDEVECLLANMIYKVSPILFLLPHRLANLAASPGLAHDSQSSV